VDIVAASVFDGTALRGPSVVRLADGLIVALEPAEGRHAEVELIAPGFVDLQVNGIDDVDVAVAGGDDWARLDDLLIAQGTTAWLPTLVTNSLDRYTAPLRRVAEAMADPRRRTHILGAHLEGPFLGKAHGAHRPSLVRDIDLGWLADLAEVVKMVTLGPEQPGAPGATALLRARGVAVSLGHTTATDAELDACAAAGATMVTHLFNGMSGLHHRQPGVAAWALNHDSVLASLIVDFVHAHPTMVRLGFRLLGDRAVLVTDSVGWRAGSAGPVRVQLVDGAPRLADGTLAGSALTMDQAVRNCVAAGVPLTSALRAATSTPARCVGADGHGALTVGGPATLVELDAELQVRRTWVDGVVVHQVPCAA
jgi:N-acetylglucosamine-6-phosphate deacetylase